MVIALVSKVAQFITDLTSHVFVGETDIVYASPIKPLVKKKGSKKADGLPTPERYLTITKLSAFKVFCGVAYKDLINMLRVSNGMVGNYQPEPTPAYDKVTEALYVHNGSTNADLKGRHYIRGYLHAKLLSTLEHTTVYMDAAGVVLTKEEVNDLFTNYVADRTEGEARTGLGDEQPEVRHYIPDRVKYLKNNGLYYNDLTDEVLRKLGL